MAFGMECIFGTYTVTFAGVAMGVMDGGEQGVPTIVTQSMGKEITNTDLYGDQLLGYIYRGMRARIMLHCREAENAAVRSALWPWSTEGRQGVIGQDGYDLSAAVVLTAVAGTPAATKPASLTASKCVIKPGFDVARAFGPVERTVKLEMDLMTYNVAANTPGLYTRT